MKVKLKPIPQQDQDDRRLLRQCLGKTGWPSIEAAEESVRRLGKRGSALHTYQCELCGLYHLGHRRADVNLR
jgi:predicted SprT family Zn-dependent metalloprotease